MIWFSQLFFRFFPGVIGCLDGCHLEFEVGARPKPFYLNHKSYYSINLMAIVTYNMSFLDIFVGWPGRSHDSRWEWQFGTRKTTCTICFCVFLCFCVCHKWIRNTSLSSTNRVFENAPIYQYLSTLMNIPNQMAAETYSILADKAFPLVKEVMTPYKGKPQNLTPAQRKFNRHLNSKRHVCFN